MLKSLQIRNYVLIDSLDVDFPEGLAIITGQTGAGKSILIGALSLLLGSKADASVIGDGEERCVVEALFEVPESDSVTRGLLEANDIYCEDGGLTVRRVVARTGRSRSFVNDSPVNLQLLQDISSRLVDIHSQHRTLLLSDHAFQRSMLDHFAGNVGLLEGCASAYRNLKSLERDLAGVSGRLARLNDEKGYVHARWQRLEEARLREGELEDLEAEQRQLANAEVIKENLGSVEEVLGSLDLKDVRKKLEKAGKFVPGALGLAERVESSRAELNDILEEASSINSRTELSPGRLEAVEGRMSELYGLMKNYSASSVTELLAQRDALSGTLFDSDALENRREELEREMASVRKELEGIASRLHGARVAATAPFADAIRESLASLELEHALFEVEISPAQLSTTGSDEVRFMFSASGGKPEDVARCASGGEMSRLMLCLKAMMARFANMPTLVFDEIDSGVSGSAADKMGEMICTMGKDMQVFAITHLPQVAAKGDAHYLVEKEYSGSKATTSIHLLSGEERVMEIARMLSGSHVSAAAIGNAKALLSGRPGLLFD